MPIQTATNPTTGERIAFINGQWVPYTQSATNDAGQKAFLVGSQWMYEPAPEPAPEPEKGFFSNIGNLLVEGGKQAIGAAKVAPSVTAGTVGQEQAATIAEEAARKPKVMPKELQETMGAFKDESKQYEEAKGGWETAKAVGNFALEFGKQALTNPKGVAYMTAQSAANMAPSIAGMIVGGKAGALAGSPLGPGGAAIGATIGGIGGGFAGQAPMEIGAEFIDRVKDGLQERGLEPTEENVRALLSDKAFVDKAVGEARTKGLTTAAVDSLMTVGAGKFAAAPRRAAIKAAQQELGVTAKAADVAKRADEILKQGTMTQRAGRAVGRGAGAVGIDVAGGGLSEAAGQYAAYGKVDPESVALEMLGELGGSMAEVPGAAYATTRDLARKKEEPAAAPQDQIKKAVQTAAQAPQAPQAPEQSLEDLEREAGLTTAPEEPAAKVETLPPQAPKAPEPEAKTAEETAPTPKAPEQPAVPAPTLTPPAAEAPVTETPKAPEQDFGRSFLAATPESRAALEAAEKSGPMRARVAIGEAADAIKRLADTIKNAGYSNLQTLAQDGAPAALIALKEQMDKISGNVSRLVAGANASIQGTKSPEFGRISEEVIKDVDDAIRMTSDFENLPPAAQEMEGVAAPGVAEIEQEVEQLTKEQEALIAERTNLEQRTQGTSLVQALRSTLNDNEMSELAGRARQVGKNPFINLKAPKGKTGASMEDMVNSGKLDIFLPYEMRTDSPSHDNAEAAEYIREKLRNNQYYTYDTEQEIGKLNVGIQTLEDRIAELLSIEEINREIQRAIQEQRELDEAAAEFAAESPAGAAPERKAQEAEATVTEPPATPEDEGLKLESPTKGDVIEQEGRKAKAAEQDEKDQIRKESEAGAGQFKLTQEEGRQDTTGGLFDQPQEAEQAPEEPAIPEVTTEEEIKQAMTLLDTLLSKVVPPFKGRTASRTITLKPKELTKAQKDLVKSLFKDALDLGMPAALIGNIERTGATGMDSIASITNPNGWLMLGKQWAGVSLAKKLHTIVHELGHSVDYAHKGMLSENPKWAPCHAELEAWYKSDPFLNPLSYPFASQFKGKVRIKQESFAQAFAMYFTNPVDMQKNAPQSYSEINSIVERIRDESRKARAAGQAKTGTAGIQIYPARAEGSEEVRPGDGAVVPDIGRAGAVEAEADQGLITDEQTRSANFKRWFGNSKVVDDQGKPLVVYHGTNATFPRFEIAVEGELGSGYYFSESPDSAEKWGMRKTAVYGGEFGYEQTGEGVNLMPVFLRLKNPASYKDVVAAKKSIGADWTPQQVTAALRSKGFDGVWSKEDDEIVAFFPEQIKSATGNRGTFDPELPDILNIEEEPKSNVPRRNIYGDLIDKKTWEGIADSKLFGKYGKDDLIRALQDKYIDLKRVQTAIKNASREIGDKWDAYVKEELFHGRTAKRTQDFINKELDPVLEEMKKNDVSIGEMEQYLHNRHAEEYNKQVAKVNPNDPEMQDGGSGINTEDAREYLANIPEDKRKVYESIAAKIDSITKGTRELLVESGLEKADTIKAWEEAFPFYVPLQREDIDFQYTSNSTGTGRGFDQRGSFSRRAMGSKRNVVDILANIAMQRERAIVKSEKNRVSQAVYGLAIQNPNPDFWMAVNPAASRIPASAAEEMVALGIDPDDAQYLMQEPTQRALDKKRNEVINRVNGVLRDNKNVLATRVNGEDRYVFFNNNDERAKNMVSALKNLDADGLMEGLGLFAKATRYLAAVNTQYNPFFGAYNFLRDTQGAALQLSTTPIAGKQKEVIKGAMPALFAIYKDLRRERKKATPEQNEWVKLWQEFQSEGGQTGFRDTFSRSQDRSEAIQKQLSRINENNAMSKARAVFDWLSDYNDAMENAVRLSAYKVALDQGMTKQQAASVAKNLTVNFNRKGTASTTIGALWAFFNAAMQGTTRLVQTLRGPAGRKIIAGGLLLGAAQAIAMALAGYEEDEPPDFVKERNLLFPILGTDNYIMLPMPLGYHVIPSTGRMLTEAAMAVMGLTKSRKGASERMTDLMGMYMSAFNPIGNAGWSAQTFAPTLLDPWAALDANKDWTGKRIYREDFSKLDPTPGFTRAKDAASLWSTKLAEFFNYASGGTEFRPGTFSPTPDQIDYLIGVATGGIGREVTKLGASVKGAAGGEEVPLYKVPVVGRFVGETKGAQVEANRFYRNIEHLNKLENEIKGRASKGGNVSEVFKENPEAALYKTANKIYEDIKKLKTKRDLLKERGVEKGPIQALNKAIEQKMKALNDAVDRLEK